jgi:hypothetical protein
MEAVLATLLLCWRLLRGFAIVRPGSLPDLDERRYLVVCLGADLADRNVRRPAMLWEDTWMDIRKCVAATATAALLVLAAAGGGQKTDNGGQRTEDRRQRTEGGGQKTAPLSEISFNGGWRFARGEQLGAQRPDFDDSTWQMVRLPHDWAISGPFNAGENGYAGKLPWRGEGWYRRGEGWYRKTFTLPEVGGQKTEDRGRRTEDRGRKTEDRRRETDCCPPRHAPTWISMA